MSKGVLLFAFNTEKYNYYDMAISTAKRANHFLNLPVTVVTDENSVRNTSYTFDNQIIIEADKTNRRDWGEWFNKGRYKAYELSPYDTTILLDTDYMINSDRLSKLFDLDTDFCCHDTTSFMMQPSLPQERLSVYSYDVLWATAIKFNKSKYSEQIFDSIKMIQNNYDHYSMIHGFMHATYRNDYALTLSLRLINGHTFPKENIIPWNLVHIGKNTSIHKNTDNEYNTEYTILFDNWQRGKIRKEYLTVKDMDFHVMVKENYMELIS